MFPRRRLVRQPTHCSVPGSPWRHGGSMFASARNAAITSSVGRSLEDYSSKTQQRSCTTMAARWQHGCLWQEPCMDVSMIELSKRTLESKNREEGNGKPPRLFPYRHDSHWWLLRRCLATVAAVLRRQLPPAVGHRRLLQGCLAAVAAVLHRRLPLPSDGSHWLAVFSGTAEYQKRERERE